MDNGETGWQLHYEDPTRPDRPSAITLPGETVAAVQHDANGNLTEMPGRRCEYDFKNHLSRVTLDDGAEIRYDYDYRGNRVRRRVTRQGATTETIYLGRMVEVHAGTHTNFVIFNRRRVALRRGAVTRWIHVDPLGSATLFSDEGGGPIAQDDVPALRHRASPAGCAAAAAVRVARRGRRERLGLHGAPLVLAGHRAVPHARSVVPAAAREERRRPGAAPALFVRGEQPDQPDRSGGALVLERRGRDRRRDRRDRDRRRDCGGVCDRHRVRHPGRDRADRPRDGELRGGAQQSGVGSRRVLPRLHDRPERRAQRGLPDDVGSDWRRHRRGGRCADLPGIVRHDREQRGLPGHSRVVELADADVVARARLWGP